MIQLGLTQLATRESSELSQFAAQSLEETAVWCSLQNSLNHALRSPELDQSATLEPPTFPDTKEGIHLWIQDRYVRYRQAVSQLTQLRSDALHAMNEILDAKSVTTQGEGKVLIYFPMETVTCGASDASSLGFFDGHDAPPWDTWFWYSEDAIFSWVPQVFISRAQAGIDANPVDCIHWATRKELSRLTKSEGVIDK